ncbi:alpha/beta hydrolase, partial [Bacillus cereus]
MHFFQVLYVLFYGGSMLKNNFKISNIPAVLWGEKSEK